MENKTQKKLSVQGLMQDDSGVGVVEIILILVVLIALVVIFKDQLTSLVRSLFGGLISVEDASSLIENNIMACRLK